MIASLREFLPIRLVVRTFGMRKDTKGKQRYQDEEMQMDYTVMNTEG